MADLQQIFSTSTALYNRDGIFDGSATLTRWRELFGRMHGRLRDADASDDEMRTFATEIDRVITDALETELNDDERTALHDELSLAFSGTSSGVNHGPLSPKAGFLRHVQFTR